MSTVKALTAAQRAENRAERERRLDIYTGLCEVAAMARRAAAAAELAELAKIDARELSRKKYEDFRKRIVKAIGRGGAM